MLSHKQLHELIVPVIKTYQRWIQDLAALCIKTSETKEMKAKVDQIQRKHQVNMKPTLKNLAIFEAYGNSQKSNGEYTKTFGLANRYLSKELPMEFHRILRAVFNKAKTAVEIAQEIELNRIKNLIE